MRSPAVNSPESMASAMRSSRILPIQRWAAIACMMYGFRFLRKRPRSAVAMMRMKTRSPRYAWGTRNYGPPLFEIIMNAMESATRERTSPAVARIL